MKWLLFVIVIIKSCTTQDSRSQEKGVSSQQLENWASEFGGMLYELSSSVTKYKELQGRFQHSNGGSVEKFDLHRLINEILEDVDKSNHEKIEAVMRISNFAEQKALEELEKKSKQSDDSVELSASDDAKRKNYFNAKKLNLQNESGDYYFKLSENAHFGGRVNTTTSTVHVPTSIYDEDENVLDAIEWSSDLDLAFRNNYKHNPTLSWQYFGSSTGFLRQFPGVKWRNTNEDEHDPDLYDCRFRPWYASAANYPKNLVILHDTSGSMTGLRREIAKHVVSTILDTLTENDFVAVFNFTDETTPLVPCFENRLVQANLKNIREFKVALEQDRTAKVANFTTALLKAFEVLEKHREPDAVESAKCNQAIMLITDGAPYHFEEIFKAKQDPENYVRMFTYLIGREVTDKREIMWMACAHKGYFVHVTTLGEVQEQVLKYMPVMSRPMVMYKLHNVSWTPVYADINLGDDRPPMTVVQLRGNRNPRHVRFDEEDEYEEMLGDEPTYYSDIRLVPWQRWFKEEVNRLKRYWIARFHKHVQDVGESDWKWDKRNRGRQRERSGRFKEFIKIFNSGNDTVLAPFSIDAQKVETKKKEKKIRLARSRVQEYLDYGMLDATPEQIRAKYAEQSRIEINLQTQIKGHIYNSFGESACETDHTEAITAKKLDMRMKKHAQEANKVKWPKGPSFNFMVTVSYPVFDLRNATTRELKVKLNDTLTLETIEQKRIANFLGVVGTDVPIKELIRMTSPFKLGVNGYAFAVTNNGHVIFHPDWRPILPDDILKPNYNAIDIMELELMDNDTCFRNNDSALYELRKDMVDQVAGHKNLRIRVHQDQFRRVTVRHQKYEYQKMANTSYSLGISVPQNMYRFQGTIDVIRMIRDGVVNVSKLFDVQEPNQTRKWKLHPEWTFCEYIRTPPTETQKHDAKSKDKVSHENRLMEFIRKMQSASSKPFWGWKNTMKPKEDYIYHCDRDLIQSLVFDANVTEIFSEEKLQRFNKDDPQFIEMYGVHLAFIATRTGLTRWIGPLDKNRPISSTDVRFEDNNIRAIDELWYKRAVERWYVDRNSFVYSIPFDAGTRSDNLVLVTATRAIFVESDKSNSAPVAVTGIQFDHAKWREKFFQTTSKCMPGTNCMNKTCDSGTLNCYVLDDNGFVLISEESTDHGKFFGEIDGMVMEMLVKSEIYKQVRAVDYQATCFHPVSRTSFANFLTTPFHTAKWLLNLALSYIAWFALQVNIHSFVSPDFTSVLAEFAGDDGGHIIEDPLPFVDLASINKTRLRPCDQEYKLYTYGPAYNTHNLTSKGMLTACGHSKCSGFFNVHFIRHTNLILVVTDGTCRCPNTVNNHSIRPEEVMYQVDEAVRNLSAENEIVAQICRTPNSPPLYRNRMYNEKQCLHYHAEEDGMKADCGLGTIRKSNCIIILLSTMIVALVKFTVALEF